MEAAEADADVTRRYTRASQTMVKVSLFWPQHTGHLISGLLSRVGTAACSVGGT